MYTEWTQRQYSGGIQPTLPLDLKSPGIGIVCLPIVEAGVVELLGRLTWYLPAQVRTPLSAATGTTLQLFDSLFVSQ